METLSHCRQGICLRDVDCDCRCRGCKASVRRERRQEKFEASALRPEQAVGRTVSKVRRSTVEGPYGPEPYIAIYFKDGTHTGFVLPDEVEHEWEDVEGL